MSHHEMADEKADTTREVLVKRTGPAPRPVIERIQARVRIDENGCWIWHGALSNGYGQIQIGSRRDGDRRTVRVHRAAYESLVGPIPDGLELDHLCRNPLCCNPDHLEPVTTQINALRRGAAVRGVTLCARGLHERTTRTTIMVAGKSACGPCNGVLR